MLAHQRRLNVSTLSSRLLAIAVVCGAAGCLGPRQGPPDAGGNPGDGTPTPTPQPSELGYLQTDGVVDFGERFAGGRYLATTTVVNTGAAALRFRLVAPSSAVPFAWDATNQGDWTTLAPAASAVLSVVFTPPEAGGYSASMKIALEKARNGSTEAIRALGVGLHPCPTITPATVDFGDLSPLVPGNREIIIAGAPSVRNIVLAITGDREFEFKDLDGYRTASVDLGSNGRAAITLIFSDPSRNGSFSASLKVSPPGDCVPQMVALSATVTDSMVNCSPALSGVVLDACEIDFGPVQPGDRSENEDLLLRNLSGNSVVLNELRISPSDRPFAIAAPVAGTELHPGGMVGLRIQFQPTAVGPASASLEIVASDSERLVLGTLTGLGGGPKVRVSPESIDVGVVLFHHTKDVLLTVENVGTDVPGTQQGVLLLSYGALRFVGSPSDAVKVSSPSAGFAQVGARAVYTVTLEGQQVAPITGNLVLDTNASNARVSIPVSAVVHLPCQLKADPSVIAFGIVEPGFDSQAQVVLHNGAPGDLVEDCTLTQFQLAMAPPSAHFMLLDAPMDPVTLKAGERLLLHFHAAPDSAGSLHGALKLDSSGTPVSVPLQVDALTGCLAMADPNVEFGTVETGCSSAQRTLTLHNGCPRIVRLYTIDLETASSAFALQPPSSRTIAVGGSFEIPVFYAPSAAGDDVGTVAVNTDEGVMRVPVHGAAKTGAIAVEEFAVSTGIDVLAVVDQSTGTRPLVSSDVITAIKTELTTAGLDWQLGTVPDAAGRLETIESSTSTTRTLALPAGYTAVSGDFLEVARQALTYPMSLGHNAGFVRQDAALAVLVVGDAADQVSVSAAYYASIVANRKSRPGRAAVFAVVPTLAAAPAGCSYATATAGQGTLVRDAAQSSGGRVEEYCAPDTSRLAKAVAALPRRFALRGWPDVLGCTVEVNGVSLPSSGASGTNWTYDTARNELVFARSVALAAGDVVRVSFVPKCQ